MKRTTHTTARRWRAGAALGIAFAIAASGATAAAADDVVISDQPEKVVLPEDAPAAALAEPDEPEQLSEPAGTADPSLLVIPGELKTHTGVEYDATPTNGWFNRPLNATVVGYDDSGLGISGVFFHRGQFWEDVAGDRARISYDLEGTHVLKHYAINENGVRSETNETQFSIDYTPPNINPSIPDIFQTDYWVTFAQDEHVPFSYTCADALSGVASCSSDIVEGEPLPTDEVGDFLIPVTAADVAGNTITRKIRYRVIKAAVDDNTAPVVTFYTLSEDLYYESGKTFALVFDCADPQSDVTSCLTEDGLHSGDLVTMVYTPENRGLHTWTVVARNAAGLTTRETISLRVAPAGFTALTTELTFDTDAANGWHRTPVTATVLASTSSEFPIRHVMTNQGNGWMRTTGDTALLLFDTEGVSVVEHYTVDDDFMESLVRESVVRIDYTPPMINSSTPELFEDDFVISRLAAAAPSPVFTQGEAVAFDFTCEDELSGVDECAGDLVSGELLPTDTVGEHRYTVLATDLAGNEHARDVHYIVTAAGDTPNVPVPVKPAAAGVGSLAHTGGGTLAAPLGLLAALLVALGSALVIRAARR